MDLVSALALIGTVVGPLLKDAAEEHVKKYFGRAITSAATDDTDALIRTADRCMREWLAVALLDLMEEYEDPSRCEAFLSAYREPLVTFLSDTVVRGEVLLPLTTAEARPPDAGLLARQWTFLELPALPDEFKLSVICEKYARRVRKASLVDPELRARLLAIRAEEQARYLRGLRGVWPDFDLDVYAHRMKKRYRALDLSALVPPDRDDAAISSMSLRDVFVPPRARDGLTKAEVPKDVMEMLIAAGHVAEPGGTTVSQRRRGRHTLKTRPVLDRIATERRLVLLGDPGAGKSTIARYVLLSLLDPPEPPPKWAAPLQEHLPLLIELRDYHVRSVKGECQGFLEYLHLLGKTQGYKLNHIDLADHLKSRPALIIFDGLDEVFEANARQGVIEEIVGFSSDFPLSRILVTSRIVGYHGLALREAGFEEATITELNHTEVMRFSRGWFSIVFRDRPDEARAREQRIQRAIASSKAIKLLAGNPLLLTIIAILARFQELPRDRARLYDHAVRVLCHHWDFTFHRLTMEGLQDDVMDDERKLGLLRQVAWRMQSSEQGLPANAIVEADLREEIRSFFQSSLHQMPAAAERNAVAMIDHLRSRNFILCLHGPGVYGFVHRTFLEFLCATAVVRRFEKERSLDEEQLVTWAQAHAHEDAWREVLRLTCGQLAPSVAGKLIGAMLERDALSALQCIAEVGDREALGEVTEAALSAGIRDLFGMDRDPWDATYMALREEVLALAKALPRRGGLFYALIEVPLTSGRYRIDEEVVTAIWGDEPLARQLLISHVKGGGELQSAAADLLGQTYWRYGDAVEALQGLLFTGGTEARAAAGRGVARASCRRVDIRGLVRTLLTDNDPEMRASVAKGLSRSGWPDELLESAARTDVHSLVRAGCFDALSDAAFQRNFPGLVDVALAEDDRIAQASMLRRISVAGSSGSVIASVDDVDLRRMLHSPAREIRTIAMAALARRRGGDAPTLLSVDLDGLRPFIDPQEEVTWEFAAEAASVLEVSEDEVRRKYEGLAAEFLLRLSWKSSPQTPES